MSTDLFDTKFIDCWIVSVVTGEYSDRSEFPVAVFLSEEKARDLLWKLDEMTKRHGLGHDDGGEKSSILLKALNDEAGFKIVDHVDYTGLGYFISKTTFGG